MLGWSVTTAKILEINDCLIGPSYGGYTVVSLLVEDIRCNLIVHKPSQVFQRFSREALKNIMGRPGYGATQEVGSNTVVLYGIEVCVHFPC